MSIGKKIKDLRIQRGMTQGDVAKALKTTCQAIFKYEQEIVTNIPTDKIEQLANLFNVSPSYLIGWDEQSTEYVPLPTDALTEEEWKLLEKFRGLSEDRKALAIRLLDPLEESQ